MPRAEAPRVLVTGGARRLGAAIAAAFGARGCRVAVHAHRSGRAARAVAAELPAGSAALAADLRDPEAAADLPERAAEALGGLDVVVNSAAAWERAPLPDLDAARWDAMLALNLRAPFLVARAAAPRLARASLPGGGAIVNIADIFAARPLRGRLHYCVAKAGLLMLTRGLALELAPQVRVNAVSPGLVLPPEDLGPEEIARIVERVPLRRPGRPEDVARLVVALALDHPYVTGQVWAVDGGRSVVGPDPEG